MNRGVQVEQLAVAGVVVIALVVVLAVVGMAVSALRGRRLHTRPDPRAPFERP
ncbi:hypothetical protein [Saccharothrix texasensis]|uniref:Uncharacterized protein n=1 Tax=Saccharothrix texasensis TaxID=103734 RepID=A0A3N1H150_9PSEU|nr:hypothetical protein [Saccharothrix texasensis]ROP36265.1 hypothetical protein EDD40_1530 [Saccharothrix texasensis]